MRHEIRPVIWFVVSVFVLFGSGCGKDSEESGERASSDTFRIPDTMLSLKESFKLTRDEYHPVKGGVLANQEIELHYPPSSGAKMISFKSFEYAWEAYRNVSSMIEKPADGKIVLIGTKDLDEYRFLTRKEWWYYGTNKGDTIYFEPFGIMLQRGIAKIAITQKMAQAALSRLSRGGIPNWLREAVASYTAGERDILENQIYEFYYRKMEVNPTPELIETELEIGQDRAMSRISFFAAYRMLEKALEFSSMDDVMKFIALLGEGRSRDEASKESFGMDYGELIERVRIDGEVYSPPGKAKV